MAGGNPANLRRVILSLECEDWREIALLGGLTRFEGGAIWQIGAGLRPSRAGEGACPHVNGHHAFTNYSRGNMNPAAQVSHLA